MVDAQMSWEDLTDKGRQSANCPAPMPPEPAVIAASIDSHRASPEVGIKRHSRNKQVELASSLLERRAIYLDLKFWIGLRDADAAGSTPHPYGDLLTSLRQQGNRSDFAYENAKGC
ncbi:hypothetical protein [Azoarcus sp. CIB]|uniref:hypothetical protein n=1 Tax=Aromatoleum sp. (strain CIB) TaxID=198107 RepID=UPI000A88640B|nr:hypothetical protein [Azoarcus sp. CIB]